MIDLEIGKLNKQIIIQNVTSTGDGGGGRQTTWNDGDVVWANIRPTTGKQFSRAGKISFDMSHVICIRYKQGITPKTNRLKLGERIFKIMSVENLEEQNRFIEMFCLEVI